MKPSGTTIPSFQPRTRRSRRTSDSYRGWERGIFMSSAESGPRTSHNRATEGPPREARTWSRRFARSLRLRLLMGANDLRFQLADHEVPFDGVERHAVGGTLHEAGLPRRDEGRGDSLRVQGVGEEERRRPLADRPVRPEDRDPEAGQFTGQVAELLRLSDRSRLPDVDQTNPVGLRECGE